MTQGRAIYYSRNYANYLRRESRMNRASWHLRANAIVAAWLVAVVVVSLIHPFFAWSSWLLVHLLALGALSNAILIWSWHFTAALVRLSDDVMRKGQALRLALFNAGAMAVMLGVTLGFWPVTAVGGIAVAGVAGWHAVALLRRMRAALPSRFRLTVRYYVAAGALLPLGAVLGVLLARGEIADDERIVLAHALVNILGWVGLTVIGTLVTLWPTMLRTRIADGAELAARRMLPVLLAGLLLATAATLWATPALCALGLVIFLGGFLAVAAPHLEEVRRKAPVELSTGSVLAAVLWLTGSLGLLSVAVGTSADWSQALARAGGFTVPVLVGFAAQVLVGALSYLVPVVLGGGPSTVRRTTAIMGWAGGARLAATNAGLLLWLLPVPSLVKVLESVVVLASLAVVVPLMVICAVVQRRPSEPSAPATRPGLMRSAAIGLGLVVLAAAGGVALDPAGAGLASAQSADAGVTPTGHTTSVDVRIEGMRYVPATIEVPAGDQLLITVQNTGEDRHDLVLETGARTPRLAPGEQATLDAGVVGRSLDGWCSVAGHRQMGMVLTVNVIGGSEHDHAPSPTAASAAEDLDLMADPGPGFTPREARLAPAGRAKVHRLTLTVQEVEREVAPGVTQRLWTFNGTAPGPVLRGQVGDVFDITLVNDGSIGHSIDVHAGALAPDRPMRTIQPGESLRYRFSATRAGIWMYHCSTMPMSMHIANGMFGAVIIDPPGLREVDKEYVLVQSEMYLGPQGEPADADKIAQERPDLVVFNGYANQYDHAPLTARVGQRVRIWVLAAGPQRGTAFHVVGGQFDTVWREGAYDLRAGRDTGAQVLGLTPAQGGFVELTFPQPGHYPFVTHAMVDAERGARGIVHVRR